jgi:hypothetical protein
MNMLNQTEPATFSILPCWAFFRDSVFIYCIQRSDWLFFIFIYNVLHNSLQYDKQDGQGKAAFNERS